MSCCWPYRNDLVYYIHCFLQAVLHLQRTGTAFQTVNLLELHTFYRSHSLYVWHMYRLSVACILMFLLSIAFILCMAHYLLSIPFLLRMAHVPSINCTQTISPDFNFNFAYELHSLQSQWKAYNLFIALMICTSHVLLVFLIF